MSAKKYTGKNHRGSASTSPYPVSRLAPNMELVQIAEQIAESGVVLNTRVNAKMQVIAKQIRMLQDEARKVLEEAQQDMQLHQAACNFKRQPGKIYHLYRKSDGSLYFSMLSPADWRGAMPHEYAGSYRLENDMGWTPVEELT